MLVYFSYKNKELKINQFYVFIIRIFQNEIKNLRQSFMSMIRFFANLSGEDVLVNNPLNYDIIKFVLNQTKVKYSIVLIQDNFEEIEK